jgi:hypothetical protein
MVERDALWAVHRAERDELYRKSNEAAHIARDYVISRYRPVWRELYKAQREEFAHLKRIESNPLERAIYVFVNSERLGNGAPLTMRQKASLIQSPAKLFEAVSRVHTRERRAVANAEKYEISQRYERVSQAHNFRFGELKARQDAERANLRVQQKAENKRDVSYHAAQLELAAERRGVPTREAPNAPPFETDEAYVRRIRHEIAKRFPPPTMDAPSDPTPEESRAEQIRRSYRHWYRKRDDDLDRDR